MDGIRITGLDKLERALAKNAGLQEVKRVVRRHGIAMQRKMVGNADFTRGYQTGQTKHSIHGAEEDGGLTYACGPATEYAPYVNYGTRFMEAQPFATDAFEDEKPKFLEELNKLMK